MRHRDDAMTDHDTDHDRHKTYWLDSPANVKKIVWALVAVCALLFGADEVTGLRLQLCLLLGAGHVGFDRNDHLGMQPDQNRV